MKGMRGISDGSSNGREKAGIGSAKRGEALYRQRRIFDSHTRSLLMHSDLYFVTSYCHRCSVEIFTLRVTLPIYRIDDLLDSPLKSLPHSVALRLMTAVISSTTSRELQLFLKELLYGAKSEQAIYR